jgi:hypothetical protein
MYRMKTDCKALTSAVESGIDDAAQVATRANNAQVGPARPDTLNIWVPLPVIRRASPQLLRHKDRLGVAVETEVSRVLCRVLELAITDLL